MMETADLYPIAGGPFQKTPLNKVHRHVCLRLLAFDDVLIAIVNALTMALATAKNAFGQSFRIPEPPLTGKNLPSQAGRVHIVTGGYGGCGFELSKILYNANAVVYVAGRSQEKADKAIAAITQSSPDSKGRVEFMKVDLADLASIKPAVDAFLAKESRLDGMASP